jgi:hypothetical protein
MLLAPAFAAVQLSEMVQRKTGVPKPADRSDDDFLEAIARQIRNQARLRT